MGAHFESNVWREGRTVPWDKPAITRAAQTASHPQYCASVGTQSVTNPQRNCANENSLRAPQRCATMLPIICVHMYPQKNELWITSFTELSHGNSCNARSGGLKFRMRCVFIFTVHECYFRIWQEFELRVWNMNMGFGKLNGQTTETEVNVYKFRCK